MSSIEQPIPTGAVMGVRNTLSYGDNLDILRHYIPSESVDLIYLDLPFNRFEVLTHLYFDGTLKRR